jgi:NAD(P)-dependent dehydrogenase (short-subunit alcohol dehydrogenase family)
MNQKDSDVLKRFDLTDRIAIITGGAGLLGVKHAEAIASAGGIPVLVDINRERILKTARDIEKKFNKPALGIHADITRKDHWDKIVEDVIGKFGHIDILINNAANNPKVDKKSSKNFTRLEHFPIERWNADFAVNVTGAFLGCQAVGKVMAKRKKGVVVNIASDLAVIAPDQRIYRKENVPESNQNTKPVSYSVTKHALIGLTKYLATYWAHSGIRVNALSPGGVYVNQDKSFVSKLTNLIPMGRMATPSEYQAALLFLCSDASSYMTGHNLVIEGGRTVW